ncbi:unknown [Bacteroides sp. CAG:875]|jgi:hypothetical protein|nr:unknown [Bacteroides sp. CAG:875]
MFESNGGKYAVAKIEDKPWKTEVININGLP